MIDTELLDDPASLSRSPTVWEKGWDWTFQRLTWLLAVLVVVTLASVVVQIAWTASASVAEFGWQFLVTTKWDPTRSSFGILPQIWGTLYSSLIALAIGTLFGLAVAIFLTEDFIAPRWQLVLKNIIELLAAIPSVVYGLWGLFVVIPLLRGPANWLHDQFGWFPLFDTPYKGSGMLPAALVLAIMILPTITALSRNALVAVPHRLREGAIGLGATRWETIFKIVLPTVSTGIFGAMVIAFGRALGETMALAMLVGNSNVISWSLLSPADTLAALMANHYAEASGLEMSALMYAALVLMAITLVVNMIGSAIIWRASSNLQGLR